MEKLTAKQADFCRFYVVNNNGLEAAIKAGYKPKNAKVIASQNLTKLNVKQYLDELMLEKQERTKIDADWITEQYLENMKMAKKQGDTKSINTALKNLAELVGANEAKKLDLNVKQSLADIIGNINAQR
jgi:phage terminase small subunit